MKALKVWVLFLGMILVVAGWSGISEGQQASVTDIIVGNPEAMTGAASPIGRGMNVGIEFAAKQIAADGGFIVGGKKYNFKVIVEDYQSRPDQAVIATQKLITQNGARIIMGPNLSLGFTSAAEVLARERVLVMSGSTSVGNFIGKPRFDLVFKLHPNEVPRARALIKAFRESFPAVKKIAMLNPGDDVGRMFLDIYKKELEAVGVKVLYSETFPMDTTDYAGQLTTIKTLNPDALYVGYLDKHVGTIIKQAIQLGVTKIFLNSPGPSGGPGSVYQNEPGFGYAWSYATRSLEDTSDPKIVKYREDFERFLGRKPDQPNDYYSIDCHEGMMLIVAAMQKTGTVSDLEKIAKALVNLKQYPHSYLDMYFNENNEGVYTQSVGIIKDGKVIYLLPKGM